MMVTSGATPLLANPLTAPPIRLATQVPWPSVSPELQSFWPSGPNWRVRRLHGMVFAELWLS